MNRRITKHVMVVNDPSAFQALIADMPERRQIEKLVSIVTVARLLDDQKLVDVVHPDDYIEYEMNRMNHDLGTEIAKVATVVEEEGVLVNIPSASYTMVGPAETVFHRDYQPDPSVMGEYQKKVTTKAVKVGGPFAVETSEGWFHCKDGYLCIDARGYLYAVATEEFNLIYEPVK